MANIDVISLIFESFDFIRAHYREVAFPLMVLLLFSGAGNFGGSSFSKMFQPPSDASQSAYQPSPLENAMQAPDALSSYLVGSVLIIIAFIIAVAFVIAALSLSIWFYVSEHFYAVLNKKKISQDWQSRMKRHLPKAFVMAFFELVLFAAFACAIIACISLVYTSLVAAIALVAVVLVAGFAVGIYLIPAWTYYALDNRPFFESISRSFALVGGNKVHFAVFAAIFVLINLGALFSSFYACCFAFIVAPLLTLIVSLLSRVTLLKMKLAIEKQDGRKSR